MTFVFDNGIGSSKRGAIDGPGKGLEASVEQGVEIFLRLYARHLVDECERSDRKC